MRGRETRDARQYCGRSALLTLRNRRRVASSVTGHQSVTITDLNRWQPAFLTFPIHWTTTLPRFFMAASAIAALLFLLSPHAAATVLAGWSQYGENGTVEARLEIGRAHV